MQRYSMKKDTGMTYIPTKTNNRADKILSRDVYDVCERERTTEGDEGQFLAICVGEFDSHGSEATELSKNFLTGFLE